MRGSRQRPISQHGTGISQGRKVFNCIVDDTALVAGVKRSTRNGIRQWVKNGQIRLFVPLHALDQLSRQKSANSRHGEDVRGTLEWLDDATTRFPNVVTLQGADEIYEKWSEVEKFAVPRTLFSESDRLDEPEPELEPLNDALFEDLNKLDLTAKTTASSEASNASLPASPSSIRSQLSSTDALSPPTSPLKTNSSPAKPEPVASNSASVPPRLQPLFNYILWRIHQEIDPVAALESFIFLCNDQSKVNYAKGFEIRAKRLEQLREAIGREDRDFKNRQMVLSRESQNINTASAAINTPAPQRSVDDEEVVYKPPSKAPAAMLSRQQPPPTPANVIHPDTFGRDTISQVQMPPRSPRAQHTSPHVTRGTQNLPFAPRGSPRGNFRGNYRGRGNFNGGRAGFAPNQRNESAVPSGQIDPNSFERPRGSGCTGRGGRRLWVPTT